MCGVVKNWVLMSSAYMYVNFELNYMLWLSLYISGHRLNPSYKQQAWVTEGHLLTIPSSSLFLFLSSSANTHASKVSDATRRKNSITNSPIQKKIHCDMEKKNHSLKQMFELQAQETVLQSHALPDRAETAQYSALISSDNLIASCSTWANVSGCWEGGRKNITLFMHVQMISLDASDN